MVRTGLFRDRVSLLRPVEGTSEAGAPKDGYADVGTIWARVQPVGVQETDDAGGVSTVTAYRLEARYDARVKPAWRLRLETGELLEVRSVIDPDRRRSIMRIEAAETSE